jgi:hypothetical protein
MICLDISAQRVRRNPDGGALACCTGRPEFDTRLGTPKGVFPTELTSDEEMERNLIEWRQMNVLYECDGLENIK